MREMDKLVDIEDDFPYKDILYLEHHTSLNHPRMGNMNRAAQFSPFAALTGYEDKVKETARYTENEIYLDEEKKEIIRNKLNIIEEKINDKVKVNITYFVKDKRKNGGEFKNIIGIIKKIDNYNNEIIFTDKNKIKLDNIIDIEIDC